MKTVNPYLNFNGNTEEAFNFYRSVFGGEFASVMRWKDMPGCDQMGPLTDADKQAIMHISLPIGGGHVLMGTDSLKSMGHEAIIGTNSHIVLGAESKEEADRLFNSLSEGGKAAMPMQNTFWGAYYGMFTDKFGVQWMVNYEYPKAA